MRMSTEFAKGYFPQKRRLSIAEIGVETVANALSLIKELRPITLHLVDIKQYEGVGRINNLAPDVDLVWHVMDSIKASKEVEDGSLRYIPTRGLY